MNHKEIVRLAEKILKGLATDEEINWYNNWFNAMQQNSEPVIEDVKSKEVTLLRRILHEIQKTPARRNHVRILIYRIAAAASIALCIGLGSYFLLHEKHSSPSVTQPIAEDLPPGGNKAVLTLSNGNQVVLTNAKKGFIAKEENIRVQKTGSGRITYNATTAMHLNTVAYNTLTTPEGGTYAVQLSDGTLAVLDAASSITYPVIFTGYSRNVTITGQVYFEVIHNKAMPFSVTVRGQTIEDLGTHFNINAYNDEPTVTTTLVQGKIKVIYKGKSVLLDPGQQAITQSGSNEISISKADIEDVLAWKNGLFRFDHSSLHEVMRQFSRWYDVPVVYEGQIPTHVFSGEIHRNINASEALAILEYAGVHFKISNKTIIVTP